jgi:DNA-binding XRE family transcriptional regulator
MVTTQAENGFDIKRLRLYRERAGMTQSELSKRSGVNPIQICFYETGRTKKPHPKTAEKLLAALSACFREGLPPAKPMACRPPGVHRAACPHCGAPNCHALEVNIPGVEFQCVSCSRVFRLDAQGRPFVPEPAPAPARVLQMHEMSAATRERISAGQRRRHARERGEEA